MMGRWLMYSTAWTHDTYYVQQYIVVPAWMSCSDATQQGFSCEYDRLLDSPFRHELLPRLESVEAVPSSPCRLGC